jgi:hypothetical protein
MDNDITFIFEIVNSKNNESRTQRVTSSESLAWMIERQLKENEDIEFCDSKYNMED